MEEISHFYLNFLLKIKKKLLYFYVHNVTPNKDIGPTFAAHLKSFHLQAGIGGLLHFLLMAVCNIDKYQLIHTISPPLHFSMIPTLGLFASSQPNVSCSCSVRFVIRQDSDTTLFRHYFIFCNLN